LPPVTPGKCHLRDPVPSRRGPGRHDLTGWKSRFKPHSRLIRRIRSFATRWRSAVTTGNEAPPQRRPSTSNTAKCCGQARSCAVVFPGCFPRGAGTSKRGPSCRRSARACLRAILDHIRPMLGCASFTALARNYRWSGTDHGLHAGLPGRRIQAGLLHQPIWHRPDLPARMTCHRERV